MGRSSRRMRKQSERSEASMTVAVFAGRPCGPVPMYSGGAGDSNGGDRRRREEESLPEDVCCAIRNVVQGKGKVVDQKVLQKAVGVVKMYLKEKDNSVNALLNHEGFLAFFVKCLQNASNCDFLIFNNSWIFYEISSRGSQAEVGKLVDQETIAVPLLLKSLQSPERAAFEKTIAVIARLQDFKGVRAQLLSNAPSLLIPLAKFLKGKKPSEQVIQDAAAIVFYLMLTEDTSGQEKREQRIDSAPSSRIVRLALPVIGSLLEWETSVNERTCFYLECLELSGHVLDDNSPILEIGCAPKIVSHFAENNEKVMVAAILAVDCITDGSDEKQTFRFLKALKGVGGLENFWRCFHLGRQPGPPFCENILGVLITNIIWRVGSVIHLDPEQEGINTAIESGMVDSLIQAVMKSDEMPSEYLHASVQILVCMLNQLPPQRRDIAATIMPHVLEHLGVHKFCGMAESCVLILQRLTEDNLERRDRAVEMGAVTQLLEVAECYVECPEKALVVLNCIDLLLKGKPKVELKWFTEVPEGMKYFLLNDCQPYAVTPVPVLVKIVSIIGGITAYGEEGIKLVFRTRIHYNLVSLLALKEQHEVLRQTMSVFYNICQKGRPEDRKELVKMGLLEEMTTVLTCPNDEVREFGFRCLMKFLTETKLTAENRQTIKSLEGLVKAEMSGKAIGAHALAKALFQRISRIKKEK